MTAIRTTEISQSSGPINLVEDETVYKEWEDIIERAATTAFSLDAEQDSVDKTMVIIMEISIRSDLHLEDAGGIDCLPTATIFEELARMGAKTTAWNEFSSTMASAIICLATNQKFILSKHIFDAMAKHLEGGVKFLIEDASNKRRSIEDIDKDVEVSLGDETQGRSDDSEMFDTNTLIGNEVFVENDMIEKDQDGDVHRSRQAEDSMNQVSLKKKDQIALDKEIARNLEAQIQAELIEEEWLARKKEEEDNIALIESWDNTQAMMDADFKLGQRLKTEEQGEITIEERSRLFVEIINKRKKHFAKLIAEEKRRKPPTKAKT
ncbi:hypothetical protein Tco_0098084 [Tanacetum coccineum]